jgi:RHS repeat-associated protein
MTITYLYSDQVDSARMTTTPSSSTIPTRRYTAYGDKFAADTHSPLATAFNDGGHMDDGTGLVYINARYYDPNLGLFISPDTLIPDPSNVLDYNRYVYARGNPVSNYDPTGHETIKPDWWPDFLPFSYDLPDTLTPAGVKQWASENNIPTAVAGQLGGDAGAGFIGGSAISGELQWVFNFASGELTYFWNNSVAIRGGSVQNGVAAHGGVTLFMGASSNVGSIAGASQATALDGSIGTYSGAVTWSRAYKFADANGDGNFNMTSGLSEPLNGPFIDPMFDRTVDALSLNVGRGAEFSGVPGLLPGGIAHGISDANPLFTIPVGKALHTVFVSPLEVIFSWFQGQ